MNKTETTMLLIAICILGMVFGSKFESYRWQCRDDIVIKHIETTKRTVECKGISITADMTYFWVDTHTQRLDKSDERECLGAKLHLALMAAVKECKIELSTHKKLEYLHIFHKSIVNHFMAQENPFDKGRDWVSLNIKSIQFRDECGSLHTVEYTHRTTYNPYYKDNYYFKMYVIPGK